jgi:hypothetical protein
MHLVGFTIVVVMGVNNTSDSGTVFQRRYCVAPTVRFVQNVPAYPECHWRPRTLPSIP